MNRRLSAAYVAATAISISSLSLTAPAHAEGFLAKVAKAAGASPAIVDPIDRSLGPAFHQPIGRPAPTAAPGQPQSPMPYCLTPVGEFGLDPSFIQPVGAPCLHVLPNDHSVDGQIVWR